MFTTTAKLTCVLFSLFSFQCTFSQVIFSETFNESTNSTSGTDNTGGVAWTSSCPTCLTGDYWKVLGGVFEANDTNGEAVWQTSGFSVSACDNIEIAFDISEVGTLEACGTGCNSGDWVRLQYNIDGTGWQDPSNAFFCSGGCAGINVIAADDLTGGTMAYSSGCIPVGNTMQFRISVENWAQAEYWRIDNITVSCACVILPVELIFFDAGATDHEVQLFWQTASEINNAYFSIERSADALIWEETGRVPGAGNSTTLQSYSETDRFPLPGTSYYRLRQVDTDGAQSYSDPVAVTMGASVTSVYPNPAESLISVKDVQLSAGDLRIMNILGEEVTPLVTIHSLNTQHAVIDISRLASGTYFIRTNATTIVPFSKR